MIDPPPFRLPAVLPAALALLALASAGCGNRKPWGTVTGKVLLEGKPAGQVVVLFSCPEQGVEMAALTDPAGDFRLTTAQVAGLPVGQYRVAIRPAVYNTPKDGMTFAAKAVDKAGQSDAIPVRYRDLQTSGLSAAVAEGSNHFPFHLTARPR